MFVKCPCQHCGRNIVFDEAKLGELLPCPNCNQMTKLFDSLRIGALPVFPQDEKARAKRLERDIKSQQAIVAKLEKEQVHEKLQEAEDYTKKAWQAIEAWKDILHHSLRTRLALGWDKLNAHEPFSKPEPKARGYCEYPREPQAGDSKYYPVQRIELDNQNLAQEMFARDYAVWAESVERTRVENDQRYAQNVADVEEWNRESHEHQERIRKSAAVIEELKVQYEAVQPKAIEDYCKIVLSASKYPNGFPQDCDLQYHPGTKILVVEYALPAPELVPRKKEVKYAKSTDKFELLFLSESERNRLYDEALYQICLRTLSELFEADAVNALGSVSFNGWVKSVDKATGKDTNVCILSVQVEKEALRARSLQNVDPKACFKALKGVGSSKLHSLTPVAPVLGISREDSRFVASHEVANLLNEGVNLAAMDWEDFEHLIRELFEQEFQQAGGEVKITQASRDAGVDAIAFDPDVIRGGKTVIQAKRYSNTVGVSAVRDLYGTVLNEGASKGILVTTSDYGPDSYEFAKGKPLVLLNGANLLNLLEKHGHKAKIDLKEAKIILARQG